jgi:hypothetical protein
VPTCSSIPTDTSVAVPRDGTVVVFDELDVGDALACSAFPGKENLLVRDVERADRDAVVARHVQRQRAPSASRFDHGLARRETQFPADEIELGDLRFLERGIGAREIRARVDHVAVEPARVEVVAEVVVAADRRPRAIACAFEQALRGVPLRRPPVTRHGVDAFQERFEIGNLDAPVV